MADVPSVGLWRPEPKERHVTQRALDMIRRRSGEVDKRITESVTACGGSLLDWYETNRSFAAREARQIVSNRPDDYDRYWPTCVPCCVALDAALEQRDLTSLLGGAK